VSDLWQQVEQEIQKYDLLTHPFYRAWTAGELTHGQLAFYGEQYLHHVAAFPTYLTALHSRLPEGSMRKAVLANAVDEEIDGVSHSDLWRRFVDGMSAGSPSGDAQELSEVAALVGTFKRVAEKSSAATALGAFYAYESQVPRVAAEKLSGLKKMYGADDRTCEYFAVHTTADVHHSRVWRNLIDRCVENDPACAPEVLDGVRQAAQALWVALDGIEAARLQLN
jgi:pyrroloquinoline-quinone synthase